MSRLSFLVIAVLATPAFADKLVLAPLTVGEGASEAAAQKFMNLVTEEVRKEGSVEVVARPATKAAPTVNAAGKKGSSAEALKALEAGKRAYDELKFEDALPQLKSGIELALADPGTADMDVISDAYLKLAAASFRMGEEREAKSALYELARLSPSFAMPPGFPPVFQKEFEKAKKRVDKQPRGQLLVEGPAGANVYIDGRDLGMVPVTEEGVSAGMHYVKVDGGKGQIFGQAVEVKGAMTKVKAGFGASAASANGSIVEPKVEGGTLDESVLAKAASYAKAAGADFALVGIVYRTSDSQLTAATALYSTKKQAFSVVPPVAFDLDVLTANTEAFKLADEVTRRTSTFSGAASLPVQLMTKAVSSVVVTRVDTRNRDDVEVAGPKQRVLTQTTVTKPQTRTLEATVVTDDSPMGSEKPPKKDESTAKAGVPVWVWVVTGIAVAAGAGVGGYFGYREITKPVTGTVTATW